MSEKLRLHNPNTPDPVLLNEVPLKGDFIGFFPSFSSRYLHGFWWKNVPNIAYIHEPGYGSEDQTEHDTAIARVNARARQFLRRLRMAPLEKAVVLGSYPGAVNIIDFTEETLRQPRQTPHTANYIEGGAVFTTLTETPVYTIAADCAWSFIYCNRPGQPPVGGIAHSGRNEVEQFFPKAVINHLVDKYNCDPKRIEIGIMPSLEPEHHIIQAKNLAKAVRYPHLWYPHYMQQEPDPDGPFRLDVRSWIADQFIESGVLPENVVLSTVGTYQAQAEGLGASYRFATVHGSTDKRMAVGFQLAYPRASSIFADQFAALRSKILT